MKNRIAILVLYYQIPALIFHELSHYLCAKFFTLFYKGKVELRLDINPNQGTVCGHVRWFIYPRSERMRRFIVVIISSMPLIAFIGLMWALEGTAFLVFYLYSISEIILSSIFTTSSGFFLSSTDVNLIIKQFKGYENHKKG